MKGQLNNTLKVGIFASATGQSIFDVLENDEFIKYVMVTHDGSDGETILSSFPSASIKADLRQAGAVWSYTKYVSNDITVAILTLHLLLNDSDQVHLEDSLENLPRNCPEGYNISDVIKGLGPVANLLKPWVINNEPN